jgi:copper(I)-binding protein
VTDARRAGSRGPARRVWAGARRAVAAAAILAGSTLAAAAEIVISDAFARAASPQAKSGAAFLLIRNTGAQDDRLIAAEAAIAQRVELHTHVMTGDGIMQMREVEDGFAIPAGGEHRLARGGDHVMLMGLTAPLLDGDSVPVTLIFQNAGPVAVDIPVDLSR